MMKIEICGTSARCIQPMLLTSGLVGAQVEFGFDEAWEDLGRCAVFTDGVVTKDAILGEGNRCAIPHEVLAAVGRELHVGVYGTNADGDVVIPTVYVKCGTICPGTDPAGDESYPPAPDVTKQLLARMEEMEQTIGGAVNGVQSVNGETGAVVLSAEDVGALPADTKIPEIPAKISAFENDKGYLTAHQDLSGYAKKADVPTKPSDIGAQPAGNYATKADIPTVPTKVSAFTNDAGYVTASAIPAVPAKLPNPNKLTFSGAVSAEYDGSSAVEVMIPQGGGGDTWELLHTLTLAEDTKYITQELGSSYDAVCIAFTNLWCVEGTTCGVAAAVNSGSVDTGIKSASMGGFINNSNYPAKGCVEIEKFGDACRMIFAGANSAGNYSQSGVGAVATDVSGGITKIQFSLSAYGTHTMNAGAVIRIYGR